MKDFIADFDLMFQNCRLYNKNPKGPIRKACDSLEESFHNYMGKMANNYIQSHEEPAYQVQVQEDANPTSFKLSLSLGGLAALQPVAPVLPPEPSKVELRLPPVSIPVPAAVPVYVSQVEPEQKPDLPQESGFGWKKSAAKLLRKQTKHGMFEGCADFDLENALSKVRAAASPAEVDEFVRETIKKSPKADHWARRWRKRWDKLVSKSGSVVSDSVPAPLPSSNIIQLPVAPIQIRIPPVAAVPVPAPIEKMEDIVIPMPKPKEEEIPSPVQAPIASPPLPPKSEPEGHNTIKIKITEPELTKISIPVLLPTPASPRVDLSIPDQSPSFPLQRLDSAQSPLLEPNPETKVVIQNFSLLKAMAADANKQAKGAKQTKQKSTLSVTLPSLKVIQKTTSIIEAANELQPEQKLRSEYVKLDAYPIDGATREKIRGYMREAMAELKQTAAKLVPVARHDTPPKRLPSKMWKVEDEEMTDTGNDNGRTAARRPRFNGEVVMQLKRDEAMDQS